MCDVLVLDDDELVLDVTVQALEEAGYVVRMADTGAEALEILRAVPSCQLFITDINLGEKLTGLDIVDEARTFRPDLKVLYYSGLPGNWQGRPLEENARRLSKPFHFEALLQGIQDLKVWPSQPPMLGRSPQPF